MAFPVPGGPAFHAPLGIEFAQGLVKGDDRMGGRREPKLPVFFKTPVLIEQVEAHASGIPFRLQEVRKSGQDKTEPGNTLDAFVGRGNQVIDAIIFEVNGDGAEAAHGIHNVGPVEFLHFPSDLSNRVHET